MKVAVVGSRNFGDETLIYRVLDNLKSYYAEFDQFDLIISGGAVGVDKLAEQYARDRQIETKIYLPDYAKHLRGAPIRRNALIVEAADLIVVFWDGKSKGTGNTIKTAARYKRPFVHITI
jgi:predicted Rossmann fold nucleotide-binding protein DprA/Smf involved in DNA uptake